MFFYLSIFLIFLFYKYYMKFVFYIIVLINLMFYGSRILYSTWKLHFMEINIIITGDTEGQFKCTINIQ